ncbi:MAG: hypothetical protein PPP58_07720 [Natronomonas sp.]
MTDRFTDSTAETVIGIFIVTLTIGMVVLVGSLLLPGVGAYYVGDIVQDESYGTVQIDEEDGELRITATSLLNAAEIHVRGEAIDESDERTHLTADGETLVIGQESDVLSGDLHAGEAIELVILIDEDGQLQEAQTRTYELEDTYRAAET